MRRGKQPFNFKSKGSYNRRRNRGVSNVPMHNIFRGFAIVLRIAVIIGLPFVLFSFKESIDGYLRVLALWIINEGILKAIDS